ncbi:MAG: hypothetical protein R3B70_12730 [Polyangiaceae bacterium]
MPSPSVSGQPWSFGSSLARPFTVGHESIGSRIVSPSLSAQPLSFGFALGMPFTVGQASIGSKMPSPSVSTGGASFFISGVYESIPTTRTSGVPRPDVRPGPAPTPTSKSCRKR